MAKLLEHGKHGAFSIGRRSVDVAGVFFIVKKKVAMWVVGWGVVLGSPKKPCLFLHATGSATAVQRGLKTPPSHPHAGVTCSFITLKTMRGGFYFSRSRHCRAYPGDKRVLLLHSSSDDGAQEIKTTQNFPCPRLIYLFTLSFSTSLFPLHPFPFPP